MKKKKKIAKQNKMIFRRISVKETRHSETKLAKRGYLYRSARHAYQAQQNPEPEK